MAEESGTTDNLNRTASWTQQHANAICASGKQNAVSRQSTKDDLFGEETENEHI